LGRWDLQNASLYVTLEPCAMCAGAILISRVGTVVYGARSTLLGADGTWMQLFPCQHESPADNGSEHGLWPGKPHPTHPSLQVMRMNHLAYASLGRPDDTRQDLSVAAPAQCCSILETKSASQVRRGVLAEESGALMKAFFQRRRIENDSKGPEASRGLQRLSHK
jgi:tRNA(Arg) A34 adenosine deaminase TadA